MSALSEIVDKIGRYHMSYVDIVFDGPPGPVAGRFVEVEDESGASISIGEWIERADGFWALRVPDGSSERIAQLRAHRVCGNEEHDPENGKTSGFCVVCLTPWPCEIANVETRR